MRAHDRVHDRRLPVPLGLVLLPGAGPGPAAGDLVDCAQARDPALRLRRQAVVGIGGSGYMTTARV